MRFPWLILLYFLFPLSALAQGGTITGIVTNAESKKPLARASVFLSNSSQGTITADNGGFALYNVRPGQYTLIVTILGYEQYSKTVLVGNEPIKLDIGLGQKPLELREVVISSEADWKKNYAIFRKEFIGSDDNAKYCEVLNPHILNLSYNQTKQTLHADADQFLVVENKALGYRVKFLVDSFAVDKIAGLVTRAGSQVFEELPGSDAQKKKWHLKREEAYHGSPMHFYRSLISDKFKDEGFIIYHFSRYPNPERPPDNDLRQIIKNLYNKGKIDSANYYVKVVAPKSRWSHENLMQPPLFGFELMNAGSMPGLYAIHFNKYLYIVYTKKTDDTQDINLYRPMNQANYQVSIITLNAPLIQVDKNGVIVDGGQIYEGAWATQRLSDMLPVDYIPDQP